MQAEYENLKEEHPIKPESHTYASKSGSDAIDSLRKALSNLMINSVDENGNVKPLDDLTYMYLAYRDECTTYIADYITAVKWTMETMEMREE